MIAAYVSASGPLTSDLRSAATPLATWKDCSERQSALRKSMTPHFHGGPEWNTTDA